MVGAERGVERFTGDFVHTLEGEVLRIWDCVCDCDDCPKAVFAGVESHRAALYARVAERQDITEAVLRDILLHDLVLGGWADLSDRGVLEAEVDQEIDELVDLVADAPVGALLTRTRGAIWIAPEGK